MRWIVSLVVIFSIYATFAITTFGDFNKIIATTQSSNKEEMVLSSVKVVEKDAKYLSDPQLCEAYVKENERYAILINGTVYSPEFIFHPGQTSCGLLSNSSEQYKSFGKCFLEKLQYVTDDKTGATISKLCAQLSQASELGETFIRAFNSEDRKSDESKRLQLDAEMQNSLDQLKKKYSASTSYERLEIEGPIPMHINGTLTLCMRIGEMLNCN
jgi:hypothetical protein